MKSLFLAFLACLAFVGVGKAQIQFETLEGGIFRTTVQAKQATDTQTFELKGVLTSDEKIAIQTSIRVNGVPSVGFNEVAGKSLYAWEQDDLVIWEVTATTFIKYQISKQDITSTRSMPLSNGVCLVIYGKYEAVTKSLYEKSDVIARGYYKSIRQYDMCFLTFKSAEEAQEFAKTLKK
jgi:hypothetical protein